MQLNGLKYYYLTLLVLFGISWMVSSIVNDWIFLFDPLTGPQHILPLRVSVDLRLKSMKLEFHIPQAPGLALPPNIV